jgi:hypothetical protein
VSGEATAKTAAGSDSGAPATAKASQKSLSDLLARILDQLSISAWLPAAVLVATLLLLGNLHAADNRLAGAFERIGDIGLPSIILLVGAVVITTVVTQAFEFEAIRLLEGYWGAGPVATALGGVLCRYQLARRNRIERGRIRLERKTFPGVRQAMLARDVPRSVVAVVEAEWLEKPIDADAADVEEAGRIFWMDHAQPHQRRRYDALVDAFSEFPPEQLTLPTRLGNTLRSYEASLLQDRDGPPLEAFVIEIYDELPTTLQEAHDQYRGRLDLYCSLVIVFVSVGIAAIPILASARPGDGFEAPAIAAGSAAVAAWLSYRAAIASARKYGLVLMSIADRRC